jgi:hypothetical protein
MLARLGFARGRKSKSRIGIESPMWKSKSSREVRTTHIPCLPVLVSHWHTMPITHCAQKHTRTARRQGNEEDQVLASIVGVAGNLYGISLVSLNGAVRLKNRGGSFGHACSLTPVRRFMKIKTGRQKIRRIPGLKSSTKNKNRPRKTEYVRIDSCPVTKEFVEL